MKKDQSIPAFTLTEFIVALSISATIIGMLMLSYYYMGKWHHQYQQHMDHNEQLNALITTLKIDIFLNPIVVQNENSFILESHDNQKIIYSFYDSLVTRKQLYVVDTFKFISISLMPKLNVYPLNLAKPISIQLVMDNNDTISHNFYSILSTQLKLLQDVH